MAEYIDRERLLRRFNIDDMMNVNGTLISLEDARNIISNFPAAAPPGTHGKPVTKIRTVTLTDYHEEMGKFADDGANLYRKVMTHADIPYEHCPMCGATLCSRWHNYCGKCGARMDGGDDDA